MTQLTYVDQSAQPAVKGGMAFLDFSDTLSFTSAAVIPFGFGLSELATGLMEVPNGAGDIFGGIARQKHKAQTNALNLAQYEIGEAISVLRKGYIWVEAEQAVNPTLAVFLRHTVNATLVPGNFRVDVDTANAIDISAFARWVSVTTAAGLAILYISVS